MMFSKIITTDDEKNKKLFIKFHSVRRQSDGGDDKGDGFMSNEKDSKGIFIFFGDAHLHYLLEELSSKDLNLPRMIQVSQWPYAE